MAGICRDALGGMHSDRIPEIHVLAQIVVLEEDTSLVVKAFGSNMIRLRVDPVDPPPVPVTHRRQRLKIR